ncbi:MAG: DUF4340 domain-containing protein [Lachnospiraceae bacterium]|nr:DUF4340 domain-containing protein [Lachnospiraceae bacterium]
MKKKRTRLIMLIIIVAALLLGYYAVSKLTKEPEASEETNDSETLLTQIDKESVYEISYNYENESVTLKREGDEWKSADDINFPLDQSYPEAMITAVQNVMSQEIVKDPKELSEYGLSSPWMTINLKSADKTDTFEIGSLSGFLNKYYMLYNKDKSTVLTFNQASVEAFSHKLYSMVAGDKLPAINNFKTFSVKTDDKSIELVFDKEASALGEWFKAEDKEKQSPLDNTKVKEFIQNLTSLSLSNCIAYGAGEKELATYGLTDPGATISVTYAPTEEKEESFTFLLGDKGDDGYYARVAGSGFVYKVDVAAAEALMSAEYEGLKPDND